MKHYLIPAAFLFFLIACSSNKPVVRVTQHKQKNATSNKAEWYSLPKDTYQIKVPLNGRRVVIDPGHGGRFPGAVGKKGLTEKEINLRIALSLKSKLEKAGAEAILTRSTDRDFLDTGTTVKEDLFGRTKLVNALNPDLFISIHHNASSGEDSTGDLSKTFYKLGDEGPSLDAAIRIHSSFIKMLGFGKGALNSGNYSVLRRCSAPGVLGEPSYISNTTVEALLKDSSRADVEAEAYFRGIADYFAGDIPVVKELHYDTVNNFVTIKLDGLVSLDEKSQECRIDGKLQTAKLIGKTLVVAIKEPLSNGMHTVSVSAVNISAQYSAVKDFPLVIDRRTERLAIFSDKENGRKGQLIHVRVSPLDRFGMPVADGTLAAAGKERALVKNGIANFYLECGGYPIPIQCHSATAVLRLPVDPRAEQVTQIFARTTKPAAVYIKDTASALITVADLNGFAEFADSKLEKVVLSAAGFIDTAITISKDSAVIIEMTPSYSGKVLGKKVMIDPEFGGTDPGYVTAKGIRASDVTRKIARLVAGRLREAGIEITIAREGDRAINPSERVMLANETGSEFYLVIRADSSKTPYCAYYPGNVIGKKYAEILTSTTDDSLTVKEEISYITQQTPCTAAVVNLVSMQTEDPLNPAGLIKAADCIARSVIEIFNK
ncbi:MAG: N-acetylmuramoyl-L-alanine amidase [Fibrobacteres bacterium]|nr:N-acetylmuramoyl-L-alanine amidase [Fibrobacterota bacterium]